MTTSDAYCMAGADCYVSVAEWAEREPYLEPHAGLMLVLVGAAFVSLCLYWYRGLRDE